VDLSNCSVQIIECCEENICFVALSCRQHCDMVGSVDEALCLEVLEKGKVSATTRSMETVSDERDPLSPVGGPVDSGHDGEFSQVEGEE